MQIACNNTRLSVNVDLAARYPLTLDYAGNVRSLGVYSLLITGIGGTAPCRMAVSWFGAR